MKNAIVGISVGLVSILMGQTSLLSNTANAQAYGESVYGGGAYNDARPNSLDRDEDVDKGPPSGEESNPSTGAGVSNSDGDQIVEEKNEHPAESGDESRSNNSDLTPGSRGERGDPKTETSSGEGSDSPAVLVWISLGALVAAALLVWAIVTRRRAQRY